MRRGRASKSAASGGARDRSGPGCRQIAPDGPEAYEAAIARAFALLSTRARSESEVRDRLTRAGYSATVTGQVIERLRELQYLDDRSFAQTLVAERGRGPRALGRRRLEWDLAQKGVPRDVAEEALGGLSPEGQQEAADAAAAAQLAKLSPEGDPMRSRRRLYASLLRRGFDPEVAKDAVQRAILGQQRCSGDASTPSSLDLLTNNVPKT